MKDKDLIKDLFSEHLSNMESPVNPNLWNGIQAQIGSISSVAAPAVKGVSLLSKIGIAAASVSLVITSVYYFTPKEDKKAIVHVNSEVNKKNTERIVTEKIQANEQVLISQTEKVSLDSKKTNVISEEKGHTSNLSNLSHSTSPTKTPLIVKESSVSTDVITEVKPTVINQNKNNSSTNTNELTQIVQDDSSPKEVVGFINKIPNVITPNGDHENDYLFIETKNLQEFLITIMDKNNKVVFKSTDPNFKWYANDVESGSEFFYILTAVDTNGNKINKFSSLTVLR